MARLGRVLYRAFSVRSGEGLRIVLLLLHSLFIGLFIAFFTSTAFALFLARFDVGALPVVYIVSALMGWLAVTAFSKLSQRVSFPVLMISDLLFLFVLMAAFWGASMVSDSRWIAFLMLVWIVPAVTLLELEFWGLAVRLFDLRQGKRLYGLVGTGEVVSSIIGFFMVPVLVRVFASPVHLLLIAAAGVLLCVGVVIVIAINFGEELKTIRPQRTEKVTRSLIELAGDRYFLLIAALMTLFIIVLYFVDFAFLSQVPLRFEGSERVAAFIGIFFGSTKVAELITKTFLSGRLVQQFGLSFGLMVLPASLLVLALGASLVGTFMGAEATLFFLLVALTKLLWVVVKQSIFDPSFKVLFQPIASDQRLAVQTQVEGSVRQIGVLIAGIALLLASRVGLDVVYFFYVLVPLLVAWASIVVLLHREYRARLMENLSAGMERAMASSPVEALMEHLLRAPPDQLLRSITVLAKVDATAIVPFLSRMIGGGVNAAKVAALEFLSRIKALGGLPAVEACIESADDDEVRRTAERVHHDLKEAEALAQDPERIAVLASSPHAAQRDLAANSIGFSDSAEAHQRLSELLWDKDRLVRRAALVAAGRVGDQEYWHRMISQLANPAYSNAAIFGMICVGEPILNELEKAFSKSGQDPAVRSRIIRVFEHIGGPKAQNLLLSKLRFPDDSVRQQALLALSVGGYRARGDAAATVENEINDVVENTAWNMAALVDLGEDELVVPVRDALEDEIEKDRSTLFLLLSLLYDSRAISLARDNLESGSPEAVTYALEIIDLVVSAEIKPLVLPVVEGLSPGHCVRRLDPFFYQERLGRDGRLSAIVHRGRTGVWTKARALDALGRLAAEQVPQELVANIFHPVAMLQEVAGLAIYRHSPDAYQEHSSKLRKDKERLDRVLGLDDPDAEPGLDSRSLYGKVLLLKNVEALAGLPWTALITMAANSDERHLAPGETLALGEEPTGSLVVVVEGRIEAYPDGGSSPSLVLEEMELTSRTATVTTVRAREETRLVVLDGECLLELMSENIDLVDAILGISAA